MSGVNLDDLVADVLMDAGGTPRYVVKDKAMQGAQEFFRRSDGWTYREDHFPIRPNVAQYHLYPPTHTAVGRLLQFGDRLAVGSVGKPLAGFFQGPHPEQVTLTPTPTQAGVVAAVYSVLPKDEQFEIPTDVHALWAEGIRSACLYYLHSMRHQEWSDPEYAMFHRNIMQGEVTRAQQAIVGGLSQGVIEVKVPRFG